MSEAWAKFQLVGDAGGAGTSHQHFNVRAGSRIKAIGLNAEIYPTPSLYWRWAIYEGSTVDTFYDDATKAKLLLWSDTWVGMAAPTAILHNAYGVRMVDIPVDSNTITLVFQYGSQPGAFCMNVWVSGGKGEIAPVKREAKT